VTSDIDRELRELGQGLTELGLEQTPAIREKFRKYLDLLHSYHRKIHLISHRDYERISRRHFLPALLGLDQVPDQARVCDLGAGAGFPSIPIKVFKPGIDLTLFESVRKKAGFLEILARELGLAGVRVVCGRAEAERGPRYDRILIKASGKIRDLLPCLAGLLSAGGRAVFYKSANSDREICEARTRLDRLGLRLEHRDKKTPLEGSTLRIVWVESKTA
jgi:16S rRNA (guanine527-N7)-methyltransferase